MTRDGKTFESELGAKAIVEHHTIANDERMDQLREVLADIAKDLQAVKKAPPEMQYMGSFSVHVYASEILRMFAFVGVNNPTNCPYELADAALKKLRQDVNEHYKGRRQKLRSGF